MDLLAENPGGFRRDNYQWKLEDRETGLRKVVACADPSSTAQALPRWNHTSFYDASPTFHMWEIAEELHRQLILPSVMIPRLWLGTSALANQTRTATTTMPSRYTVLFNRREDFFRRSIGGVKARRLLLDFVCNCSMTGTLSVWLRSDITIVVDDQAFFVFCLFQALGELTCGRVSCIPPWFGMWDVKSRRKMKKKKSSFKNIH